MLTDRAKDWFTHLPTGYIVDYVEFMRKFEYNFANKEKYMKYVTHLFSIKQKEDEELRSFVDRFNNEALDVQSLMNEIKINLMINALKIRPFTDALVKDRPDDMEELMMMDQKRDLNVKKDKDIDPKVLLEIVVEVKIKEEVTIVVTIKNTAVISARINPQEE
ncbi:hypothetical protein BUALT_Bualt09G0007800 [Buddleja alternifolia]|uniref:Retrotransposon gag domain-containing protein n=1 Tax=Buddleja alternifolia TaxID=168488 RepID=A0AAV6WZH9_9LAMI|nr:hypothetical protein BUALT_Bualt09G0007800 [Buddleja alternifolia]